MKISDLIPFYLYKNNIEMLNIINTEEIEFDDNIEVKIDNGFKDNFIKTATEKGIENYEKLLNIPINKTIPLEQRRNEVLIRLLTTIPYTYTRLIEILDGYCGKNNYKIKQIINEYKLELTTYFLDIQEAINLVNILKYILPANILLKTFNNNVVDINSTIKVANYMTSTEIINI